ncbi:MAG: cadherin-like domain-containing protein [Chloroflexi bacterium]|nr:cadherin-like domain-containing protein [Chloroflexota bacterium]
MNGNLRLIRGLLFALLPALLLGGHHYTSTHTSTPDSAIIRASLPKKQTAHLLLTTNNKLKNRGFFRDSQQGPANGQPMAEDDIYRLLQDQPLWIEPIGVLENDHDPDGEQLAARIVQPPQHGVVDLKPDGSFTYSPPEGFVGEDAFVYQAIDPEENADTATVTLRVRDTQRPEVIWILPVTTSRDDPQITPTIYLKPWIKTLRLRVQATDNDMVVRVRFLRWDVSSEQHLLLETVHQDPDTPEIFEYDLSLEDLQPGFTEVFAQAYDRTSNSHSRSINIYRPEVLTEALFIPLLVR